MIGAIQDVSFQVPLKFFPSDLKEQNKIKFLKKEAIG